LKDKSFRFAVIGDNGSGDKPQYDVADQMERFRQVVHYDTVIMLGDNIYGGHKPQDFVQKFEKPYKAQLDNGVKFFASLGNHDDPDIERNYKLFNMNGARYYTLKKGDIEFFALDSNYMDPQQIAWLQKELKDSSAKWKICFFHHPLFSDGKFHGSDLDLRARLMPIFQAANVNLVLSGHDHVYERLKPQGGIYFFLLGSSGQLRAGDLRRGPDTEAGDDTDRTFMIMEIDGDTLYFQTISGTGTTVDSGSYARQGAGK
jgi:3',5'-cyclic AMP phosphodiesterase CpdA